MEKPLIQPEIEFWDGFDDRYAYEMFFRGYLSGVIVTLPTGEKYQVSFVDLVRLGQDLQEEIKEGRPFVAEPGLIVVEEVTMENIKASVEKLWQSGYFKSLAPL